MNHYVTNNGRKNNNNKKDNNDNDNDASNNNNYFLLLGTWDQLCTSTCTAHCDMDGTVGKDMILYKSYMLNQVKFESCQTREVPLTPWC